MDSYQLSGLLHLNPIHLLSRTASILFSVFVDSLTTATTNSTTTTTTAKSMRTESALLLHLGLVVLLQTCQGFHLPVGQQHRLRATLSSSSSRVRQVARFAATNNNNDGGGLAPAATEDETQVDNLLEQGQLRRAPRCFQEHPSLSLTRQRV